MKQVYESKHFDVQLQKYVTESQGLCFALSKYEKTILKCKY